MNEGPYKQRGLAVPKRNAGVKTAAHNRAPKQEREMAARLGGSTTPASGSREVKGDVQVARVLRLECKVTEKKSFSITREMVRKIEEAAMGSGEVPCMDIEFIDSRGRVEMAVALVPRWVLDGIAKRAND